MAMSSYAIIRKVRFMDYSPIIGPDEGYIVQPVNGGHRITEHEKRS